MIKILYKILLIIILILTSFSAKEQCIVKKEICIIERITTPIDVFVTVYKYNKSQCLTADGSRIRPGVFWCALSPDLFDDYNISFGDTIIYNDIGYIVHDITSDRLKRTVDILIHDNELFSESSTIYINTYIKNYFIIEDSTNIKLM